MTVGNAALTVKGTVTVGVNDTGHDVKLFGAAAGAYMLWDEDANLLDIRGATAAGPGHLKLTTGELTVVDADVLGKIEFQAPLETGADAILVAASIYAEADDTFSASVNNTDIVFATGKSEAAAEKFRFTADNEIGIAGANYGTDGQVLTSGGAGAAVAWEDASEGTVTAINNATANELTTIGSTTTELDAEANLTFTGSALTCIGTVTVGVDNTGHDVKYFGATSGSYWLWDEDADGVVQIGTLTVGVDDAGHDVKFFGNAASAYMLWDTSADDLILAGAAGLIVPDGQFTLGSTAVTSTAAEINLIDGGTSRGTTAVASGDGILINDAGTMAMTNVDTVSTYFASHSVGGGNIVTTGALDSGSITSGFGAIDNGTSGIRTDTFTAETSLVPDASGGADIGTTSLEWGDFYIADDKYIQFGSDQNILVGYDETTTDTLKIAATEGAGLAITLMADEGDDAGDEWKLNVADGGTITLGNDIASAGTFVTHLTLTPNSTVTSSTATFAGEVDAVTLDISGNADIDGTTNLDAVDIDGAVQIDATFTSGVDGQGYDTKFFGDTSSAYMLWDTSADDLVFAGAAGIDLAGDIDVDGTANLDVVDIDGAVDMASTLAVAGVSSFAVAANVAQGAITSSSNAVAWDASAIPNAYHLTTENTTFSAPSNATEGAFISLEINYDGSHTIGWNTVFEFAASTAPTTTDTDAKTDLFVFRYNGAVWQEVGRTLNLSES